MDNRKLLKRLGREGMMRGLPPGFRFEPTEEELVFEYLKCKVSSSALPASIIPHINLSNFDPWDLPGGDNWEEERYLFLSRDREGGSSSSWSSPSGYWKATGSRSKIPHPHHAHHHAYVGMKKTLVFYTNNNNNINGGKSKTGWVMHEYSLIPTPTPNQQQTPTQTAFSNNLQMTKKWVICRIFWNKLHKNNNNNNNFQFQPNNFPNNQVLQGQNQNQQYDQGAHSDDDSVSSTASSSNSSAPCSNNSSFYSPFTAATTMPHFQQSSDDHFSAS